MCFLSMGENEEDVSLIYSFAVVHEDASDNGWLGTFVFDLPEDFHCLDQADFGSWFDRVAQLGEGSGVRGWAAVEDAGDWRADDILLRKYSHAPFQFDRVSLQTGPMVFDRLLKFKDLSGGGIACFRHEAPPELAEVGVEPDDVRSAPLPLPWLNLPR